MRDRAQFALAGALAFAIVLIGLALILNSVIFTENLATRQGPADSTAETYRADAVDATTGIIGQVNRHNNTSRTAVNENLTDAVTAWSEATARDQSVAGVDASVTVTEKTPGTLLLQTNGSRNFTAGDSQAGDGNWTLGEADGVRTFRLNVTRSSLFQLGAADDLLPGETDTVADNAFHVEAENADGEVWRTYVFADDVTGSDDNVRVIVEDPSGNYHGQNESDCRHAAENVTIELVNGSVGGQPCGALGLYPAHENHTIRYGNATLADGDRGNGTYRILAETDSVDQGPYFDQDSGDSPFTTPAIYAATIRVTYSSDARQYTDDVEVVP